MEESFMDVFRNSQRVDCGCLNVGLASRNDSLYHVPIFSLGLNSTVNEDTIDWKLKLINSIDKLRREMTSNIHDLRREICSIDDIGRDLKRDTRRFETLLLKALETANMSKGDNGSKPHEGIALLEDLLPEPIESVDALERFVSEKLCTSAQKLEMVIVLRTSFKTMKCYFFVIRAI